MPTLRKLRPSKKKVEHKKVKKDEKKDEAEMRTHPDGKPRCSHARTFSGACILGVNCPIEGERYWYLALPDQRAPGCPTAGRRF